MAVDEADLMRRAMAAYFKGGATMQPASSSSGVHVIDGKVYVLLAGGGTVMKVYRVDTVGRLKSLKRWPRKLDSFA